jgi:hypothetical protein
MCSSRKPVPSDTSEAQDDVNPTSSSASNDEQESGAGHVGPWSGSTPTDEHLGMTAPLAGVCCWKQLGDARRNYLVWSRRFKTTCSCSLERRHVRHMAGSAPAPGATASSRSTRCSSMRIATAVM